MREESFGALLRYYRRRARDLTDGGSLSQDRLADLLSHESGIIYSRGAISDWERGKGHIHKDARHLLVSLLRVLVSAGGIHTRDEADVWLAAGNYRALNTEEAAQVAQAAGHSAEWQPDTTRAQHDRAVFMAPALPPHAVVGRDALLDTVRQQLFAGHNLALSAINGLPGVGKTTLAALLAHDAAVREHFPDGVLWAGLGRDPDQFHQLGVWARAVGIDSAELDRMGAVRLRANAIHDAIRDKRMLLVIDDVWDASPARLFTVGGSACAHVLTTRQPRIAAGFAGTHALKVAELSDAYAFELLRQLAPRVVAQEPEAARGVVRACGGLPLALVLVGNYLRIQAATGQGRRIRSALAQMQSAEKRLHVQRAQSILDQEGHPSLPDDAPISLATIIDVSDQELSDAARATLRALALFPPKPNSFSEEAALSVAGTTTEVLDELSDHGLLEAAGRERYALHQSIAEYARLETPLAGVNEQFVRYFIHFAETYRDDHTALAMELDNLTTALVLARQTGQGMLLYALLDALFDFLDVKGHYDLAAGYLSLLLESELGPAEMARVWLHFGRMAYKRDEYAEAVARWERGLALAEAHSAHETCVALLTGLNMIMADWRRYDDASTYLSLAVKHAQASDNWREVCRAEGNLGRLAMIRERYNAADAHLARALAVAEQHGFLRLACALLNMRGIVAKNIGDLDGALDHYFAGLQIARANRSTSRILEQLVNLGELLNDLRRYDEAVVYLEEALILARQFEDRPKQAHLLLDLGVAFAGRGEPEAAEQQLEAAYQLAIGLEETRLQAHISAEWGNQLLTQGRHEAAAVRFWECLQLVPSISRSKRIAGSAHFGLAQLAWAEDLADAAAIHASAALQATVNTGYDLYNEIEAWSAERSLIVE